MKKKLKAEERDGSMQSDISKAKENSSAEGANKQMHAVSIEPELYEIFGSDEAVVEALHMMVKVSEKAIRKAEKHKAKHAKAS